MSSYMGGIINPVIDKDILDSLNANSSENIVICSLEVSEDAQAGDIIDFSLSILS